VSAQKSALLTTFAHPLKIANRCLNLPFSGPVSKFCRFYAATQ
jgi:hypothetical protein